MVEAVGDRIGLPGQANNRHGIHATLKKKRSLTPEFNVRSMVNHRTVTRRWNSRGPGGTGIGTGR
jgi:hypothetical protein